MANKHFLAAILIMFLHSDLALTKRLLFDFNNDSDVSSWVEQSDPVRSVGKSKAVLAIQKTQIFQRAVLFTLLNPQDNGACFAGVRTFTDLDLGQYKSIAIRARGQGQNFIYKIVLRHRGNNDEPFPTYEQTFTAGELDTIHLKLSDFKPYYRGRPMEDEIPLDTKNITSFGLQIFGGVYKDFKQSGASSLEIDWIAAIN